MSNFIEGFKRNWRSNLIATISFVIGVPPFYSALVKYFHHQPVDWRYAIGALLLAALGYVTKDAKTNSTIDEVHAATEAKKAAELNPSETLSQALSQKPVGTIEKAKESLEKLPE